MPIGLPVSCSKNKNHQLDDRLFIIDYLQNNTETRYCMNNIYTHNTLDLDWNIYMLCCQTFLLIDDSVLYEKKI